MAILVTCKCGQAFQTKDENAGRQARCPDCGRELTVPKVTLSGPTSARALGAVTSGRALTSLLLGLASFVCNVFTGIPAVVTGLIAMGEINRSRGALKGRGLAVGGIVMGAFGFVVGLALLVPAVQSAREAGRRTVCLNNLREIGLALHNYNFARGAFPPAAIVNKDGQPLLSWRVAILPYLGPEAVHLYGQFRLDEPWDSPYNAKLIPAMPKIYACQSDPIARPFTTTYQAIVGPASMFHGPKGVKVDEVTDGTSQTIMVVETTKTIPWTAPDDLAVGSGLTFLGASSRHPGGFHALYADGSIHFLPNTMTASEFASLLSRNGGEVINVDY